MGFDWWPVAFLLDAVFTDDSSLQFQKFMAIHFCLGVLINCFGIVRGVRRMEKVTEWYYQDSECDLSQTIFTYCVCCILMFVMFMATNRCWQYAKLISGKEHETNRRKSERNCLRRSSRKSGSKNKRRRADNGKDEDEEKGALDGTP